jgi:threonine synthase
MDVGNPSNMERLRNLFPTMPELVAAVSADSIDDAAISLRIRAAFDAWDRILCPHTAVAAEVYARLPAARRLGYCCDRARGEVQGNCRAAHR